MAFEIQILAWDSHNHVAELSRLMESQPTDNFIAMDNNILVPGMHIDETLYYSTVVNID